MEQLSSPHHTLDNLIISLGKRSFNISRIRLYQLTFFLLFISTFVLTRTYDLSGMPAFVDEATHIARANRMMNTGPIISATDIGKMLHPLLLSILFRIFSVDQLWLARAFSIFMSLLGAVGCFWLGSSISKNWWVGALASLVYSLSPFTFFHDRTALADSLLTMLGIYALIFSIRLIRAARYRDAIIIGIVVGLATLTKLYGAIFAFLPILAWIVLEKKINIQRMWRLGSVASLAALVTIIPHLLVVGALLNYMRGKTVKPWEPVSMPHIWSSNVAIGFSWLTGYLTPAIIIFAALGLVLAIRRRNRLALLVGLASGLGVLLFVLVSQRWFPRYLLIAMPGFYLLAAFALIGLTDWLVARVTAAKPAKAWIAAWIRVGVLAILFVIAVVQSILFDYRLITDARTAPLVEEDRWQFVQGWPSGYGLPEAADYLTRMARDKGGIVVIRHGIECTIGCATDVLVVPEGLQIYLNGAPGIDLRTIDFLEPESLPQLQEISAQFPTYIVAVVGAPHQALPDFTAIRNMTLVRRFKKPGRNSSIDIYGPVE